MGSPIGFFTPVSRGNQSSFLLTAVQVFDDYFDFGGKKWEVIKVSESNHCYVEEKIYNRALCAHIALSILKVISIFTVVVPLLMLIGKAIARSKCQFQLAETEAKATKIQSAIRGLKGRREFQALRDTAIMVQTRQRCLKAKKEFQALREIERKFAQEKMKVLFGLNEFVQKERNHCQEMIAILNKMKEPKFIELFLNPDDSSMLPYDRIEKHIEMSKELIDEMIFAPYLAAESLYGKNKELLECRSFENMKRDVIRLSNFVCGDKFTKYLDEKIAIGSFYDEFLKLVDNKKLEDSGFNPFFIIGAQKIMRYRLPLDPVKEIFIKKIGSVGEEVLQPLDEALQKTIEKANQCQELKKFIEDFSSFVTKEEELSQKETWSEWFWKTKKFVRESFSKDLETYIEACDILNNKPKDNLESTTEAKKQLMWSKLIEISTIKDVEKAEELLAKANTLQQNKSQLTIEIIEQLLLLQDKFTKALPWISDESKIKVIQTKIEMCECEIRDLYTELMEIDDQDPAKLPEAKRKRREELKEESRRLFAWKKEAEEHKKEKM